MYILSIYYYLGIYIYVCIYFEIDHKTGRQTLEFIHGLNLTHTYTHINDRIHTYVFTYDHIYAYRFEYHNETYPRCSRIYSAKKY